jgi:LacI family transcriptional regulator
MKQKRMTLKGLAEILGVHPSTVGRVMDPQTRHMVGEEVRQRVLKEAARHGYRPNKLAAAMRTGSSKLVGVMLPDITNPVFPPIVLGIEDELRKHGYVVLMSNARDDKDEQLYLVDQLLARQVDALILATATRDDPVITHCIEAGLAVVTVNRNEDGGRVPSVAIDEALAVRLSVDHLIALGHRRLVHLVGPQQVSTGHLRKLGFEAAMAAHGLARESGVVDCLAYTREAGKAACDLALERYPDLTAIVAGNDLVAIGCYDSLRARGLRCPEDVSVIGHNDMPFTDAVAPPLTTIRIGLHEMGVQAAQLILRRLQQDAASVVEVRLRPELVVRGSTARCNRG